MQELLLRQGGLLLLLFAAHQWSSLHMELPHLCRCPSIVQWAPGAPAFHSHHTESPSPPLLCPVYLIFRFALSAAVLSLLSWHPDESWWYFSSNACSNLCCFHAAAPFLWELCRVAAHRNGNLEAPEQDFQPFSKAILMSSNSPHTGMSLLALGGLLHFLTLQYCFKASWTVQMQLVPLWWLGE